MAKNFKGKAKKPPLSAVDWAIYITAILLPVVLGYFALYLFGGFIPKKLAFADPHVIYCLPKGSAFVFPLWIYLGGVLPIAMVFLAEKKVPLLGNPHYQPPAFSHVINTVPVFSREFRQSLSQTQKKNIRTTAAILLAGLVISLLLLPFSLRSRFIFTREHEFVTYDALDRVTEYYRLEDATRLGIEARYQNGKNITTKLTLNFAIPGAEELVCLEQRLFSRMTTEEALEYMLELKSLFPPEQREVVGIEDLERVIDHRHYTPAEAALVYQLFDVTP